jgi:excisionase family DNA binding protein
MSQENVGQQSDELSATFYSVDEVASLLGISERTVYRWIRGEILPTKRIGPSGRLIRIMGKDLKEFINRDFSEEENE